MQNLTRVSNALQLAPYVSSANQQKVEMKWDIWLR